MAAPKIFIMGAGNVGASSAADITSRQLGNVFLYDIRYEYAQGQAMDINQAMPALNSDCSVTAVDGFDELKNTDMVIITAGFPRHAGMTRLDLLQKNISVVKGLGSAIMSHCPDARVLVVSNPVEILTWYLKKNWPSMNVFGLGCMLDTFRFRYFIAEALDLSVELVNGMVLGTHDNNMIPLVSQAAIEGLLMEQLLTPEKVNDIVTKTKEAGTTIVQMLNDRSGFYAAAMSITKVVESVILNKRTIYPLSVYCSGEYGYHDICLALPAVIGEKGVLRVVDINLDERYRSLLDRCAQNVADIIRDNKLDEA